MCLQQFSVLYRHRVEHCNNPRDKKNTVIAKDFKILLLSLAVSDFGVGLVNQPFYTSFFIKWLQENNTGCNCYTHKAFYSSRHLFSSSSFFGVVAVSLDRFLAVHLHLRYQELVTHKRVVAVVISIWALSIFDSFSMFWIPRNIYSLIITIIGSIGLILTTMVYIRIYLAVRRHNNQTQVLQVQQVLQTGEIANITSLINSAVGIFYVYLVFLICCLPYFVSFAAFKIYFPNVTLKIFFLFSLTHLYLNSVFESCNLLLEDETHSTRCHERTAEHISAIAHYTKHLHWTAILCHDSVSSLLPSFL